MNFSCVFIVFCVYIFCGVLFDLYLSFMMLLCCLYGEIKMYVLCVCVFVSLCSVVLLFNLNYLLKF